MIFGGVAAVALIVVATVVIINSNKGITCKLTSEQTAMGYTIDSVYSIRGSEDAVSTVTVRHAVRSDSEETRDSLITGYTEQFDYNNNRYGGYEYQVDEFNGTEVVFRGTINYGVMDMDKFSQDNVAIEDFLNENHRLGLDGAKRLYESSGATCSE